MIKEKKKITKYNIVKTKKQVFLEYARTVLCSIFIGFIITTILTINSRNEMLKNIYYIIK